MSCLNAKRSALRALIAFLFLLQLALPSVAFAFHIPTHLWYVPCGYNYYTAADQKAAEEAIKAAITAKAATLPKMVFEGQIKPGDVEGGECTFGSVIALASSIINGWILAGVIVATMGFAYAGFLYITAGGSEESIKHAHSIFVKVLIGFALMLGAWLIAKAFEAAFLDEAANARSFLAK